MQNLLAQSNCSYCNSIPDLTTKQQCLKYCIQSPGNGAQPISNPALGSLNGNSGVGFFQQLLPSLVGLAFVAGAILFFFMLLISGIQWISAGGDKGAVEAARGRLTQALIGIVVLFSAFAIIKLIEAFFGINILTLDIGPLIIK